MKHRGYYGPLTSALFGLFQRAGGILFLTVMSVVIGAIVSGGIWILHAAIAYDPAPLETFVHWGVVIGCGIPPALIVLTIVGDLVLPRLHYIAPALMIMIFVLLYMKNML